MTATDAQAHGQEPEDGGGDDFTLEFVAEDPGPQFWADLRADLQRGETEQ